MEIRFNWESIHKYLTIESLSLKEFIETHIESLQYQKVEKDYILKLNNNHIPKILFLTSLDQLRTKYSGSLLEIEVKNHQELNGLKTEVKNQKSCIDEINRNKQLIQNNLKMIFDETKLYNKLKSLIRSFDTSDYVTFVENKIFKRFSSLSSENVIKDVKILENDLEEIKKNDTIICYNKIIEYYLIDVYNYIYTFSGLFLDNEEILLKYINVFRKIVELFTKRLNERFIDDIRIRKNDFNIDFEEFVEYSSLLEKYVVLYRSARFVEEQYLVNFKFDNPIKINFSQKTYQEITSILSIFPKIDEIKNNFPEKEQIYAYYEETMKRDFRIYKLFNVKIEDYAYGFLIYETMI